MTKPRQDSPVDSSNVNQEDNLKKLSNGDFILILNDRFNEIEKRLNRIEKDNQELSELLEVNSYEKREKGEKLRSNSNGHL